MPKISEVAGRAVRLVMLAAACGFVVIGAAAADPIADRKALMKTVGFSAKAAGAMVKGEAPFDAAKAELAMRAIHAAATGLPHLFPDSSKTGGETEASPKIWEDMKGFLHQAEELKEHSAEAIEAAKKDAEAFKTAFGGVAKYCKSCHESFRVKK